MLVSLFIRNIAVIQELRMEFPAGLTIMTGETGAGKSIVIDALGLALGERADTALLRSGAAKAEVEAAFDGGRAAFLRPLLEEIGAEWQPELILRRELSAKGGSRCWLNDTPVPVSMLKRAGDMLLDLHGQHEHQSLLQPETHCGILDAFGAHEPLLAPCRASYEAVRAAEDDLRSAERRRDTMEQRRIVINHHRRQIDAVRPRSGEDAEIETRLRLMEHAERIAASVNELLALLDDGDANAVTQLGRSHRILQDLAAIDPSLLTVTGEIDAATANVQDAVRTLRSYADSIVFDPDETERLRHRLAELQQLMRAYRGSLASIVEERARLEAEFAALESIDDTVAALGRARDEARAELARHAVALSAARRAAAKRLAKDVTVLLADLGMPKALFEARIGRWEYRGGEDGVTVDIDGTATGARVTGIDTVEFYISANVGEEAKPLARTASGGEISRIMLALKSVFAGRTRLPVMVFDEIDTGVSGRLAERVAVVMRRLAQQHQVIAITHLPQIAAAGDAQLLVEKRVDHGRTVTAVRLLDADERRDEIARLISGSTVTEASLRHAAELLSQSR